MTTDRITCDAVYPTLATANVTNTCNWYAEKLGFTVRFLWGEPPTHGAVQFGEACVHFRQGAEALLNDNWLYDNWLYFDINDVDAMHQRATANGVVITAPPQDFPWGMREFNAVDLNGYHLRFGQNLGQ